MTAWPTRPNCGTSRGWYAHSYRGERPCLSCCEAMAQRSDDRRKAPARRALLEAAVADLYTPKQWRR